MNLIQLRISFANARRSWNSSGKTFPLLKGSRESRLQVWHTRKDQLRSSMSKAVNPTLMQAAASYQTRGVNSKMDPAAAQKKKKKKDFSVPQVPVNIKLALSQAKGQNSGELSLLTVLYRALLNSFRSLRMFDIMLVHTVATSEDKA